MASSRTKSGSRSGTRRVTTADAREYAETLEEEEYAGIAQSYELPEPPGHGEEVFSLIRLSGLGPDDYITRFFDTGTERQKPVSE